MTKSLLKIFVLIISILLANLITIWIDKYLMTFKWNFSPYVFTAIGMGAIVIIFYPLYTHLDKWQPFSATSYIKAGKKFAGRKVGAILAFLIAFFGLFYLYGKEWFNVNVLKQFFEVIVSLFK
jgi:uncharacterized protein YacL